MWNRLKEIFKAKSLQLVSFTITEKGYALQKADGGWFPFVEADIKNGPDRATGAMAVLTAMLYERYKAGKISDRSGFHGQLLQKRRETAGSLY